MPTTLQSYEARGFRRGADGWPLLQGTNTEVAAFIGRCAKHGWEPVLSIVADATPSAQADAGLLRDDPRPDPR